MTAPPPPGRGQAARPASRGAAVGAVLATALCLGLAAGVAESVTRWLLPWSPPERIRLGGYLLWMPAAATAAYHLLVGFTVAPLAAWVPHLATTPRLVRVFGATASFSVLYVLTPGLHIGAAAVLAAGIGSALARLARRHEAVAPRAIRRGAGALLVATLATAMGVEASRAIAERRATSTPAPAATAPNVLLLVLDNVRAFNLSAYGYVRPTSPALADLARRGVLFERAHATAPWSLPSHASLLTGRWPPAMAADWRTPLEAQVPTIAESFARAGYRTAGFVANGIYAQRESGIARGFAHYEDYPLTARQVLMGTRLGTDLVAWWQRRVVWPNGPFSRYWDRRSAADLNRRLLRWVDRDPSRPFMAMVNWFDAHTRLYAPPDVAAPPPDTLPAQGPVPTLTTAFRHVGSIRAYDRAILGMDRELRRLLEGLAARGVLDRTIIVVTSDHGEEFSEHGTNGHGYTLYLPALRVPLVIAYPARVPAGARVPAAVSIRDVPATLLALAGLRADGIGGCSLARYWDGAAASDDTVFAWVRRGINTPPAAPVSRGDMASAITAARQLIRNGDGRLELYDLNADPWEQRDLARDPGRAAEVAALEDAIGRAARSGDCGAPASVNPPGASGPAPPAAR